MGKALIVAPLYPSTSSCRTFVLRDGKKWPMHDLELAVQHSRVGTSRKYRRQIDNFSQLHQTDMSGADARPSGGDGRNSDRSILLVE